MTDLFDTIDPYVWLAILGVTAATFITRSSLFVLGARVQFPPVVEAALRFAPACALAASVRISASFSTILPAAEMKCEKQSFSSDTFSR